MTTPPLEPTRQAPYSGAKNRPLFEVALHIRLQRGDETKFPLVSRVFHWINELPYNR